MGVECTLCKVSASLDKPVFVRFRCHSCDAKWFECEQCKGKIRDPGLTKISGCVLCRPTLAKVDFHALRNWEDYGIDDNYSIDLRKSVDQLKSDFLNRIQGNLLIPAMRVMINGCNNKSYEIFADGPHDEKRVNEFRKENFDPVRNLAGNGMHFSEGYQIRIWAITSVMKDKATWTWVPKDDAYDHLRTLGDTFLWVAGLTLEEMLDIVFTTSKTLHYHGYFASNHDTSPYPVHVKSLEYTNTKVWEDDFIEHWICQCNVANLFPTSECDGCGLNLSSRRNSTTDRSRHIPSNVKKHVFDRDNGVCVICGSNENIEFDHIIPFSKGGSSTAGNIQLLCKKHNRSKGSKIL